MTEKYKIYLSGRMKQQLLDDAELFEFLKKDQSVNLNAFLRALIVNYFDDYRRQEEEAIGRIKALIAGAGLNDKDTALLAIRIRQELSADINREDNLDEAVTITVSKDSYNTIKIIEDNFLNQMGMSEYIRRMFYAYLSAPRSRRERIIFKESYEELSRAIKLKKEVSISTKALPDQKFTVCPYAITASKAEQNNYLVCYDSKRQATRSFRLSRIQNVFVRNETSVFPEEALKALRLAVKKGPQFAFSSLEESCVLLSDEGMRKYRMIYTNRPEAVKKDGNKYYFEWPLVQLEEYFKRFRKDAIILWPEKSRDNIRDFYSEAVNAYVGTKSDNSKRS